MKKYFLLTLLFCAFNSFAQDAADFDVLEPNDSLYNSLESAGELYGGTKGAESQKLSLRAYCPLNVFPASGGLSWAAAVSKAMTMQVGISRQWTRAQIEKQVFSPYYLYDQLPKTKSAADQCKLRKDWITATKDVLQTTGHIKLSDYKANAIDCKRKPSAELLRSVDRLQARAFIKVFANDTTNKSMKSQEKLFKIRRALLRNHPVVLCLETDRNFLKLKDEIWTPTYQTAPVFQAVIVIGYDEGRKAFEIAHPSGTNWGKGGFAWLRYQDVYLIKNAYEIIPEERVLAARKTTEKKPSIAQADAKPAANLKGILTLNTIDDQGNYVPVALTGNAKGIYQLPRPYAVNSQFQLVGSGTAVNSFVYVIGVDPRGKAELHYPYRKEYGLAVTEAVTPMVTDSRTEIVIPEPEITYQNGEQQRTDQVFLKEHAGTDWLLTLYSDHRLDEEVARLVEALSGHNADLPETFKKAFARHLAPASQIRFDKNRMSFQTTALPHSYVVPVLLKIEGN